jgi:predicted transglutaminase-like cysteine proteinase
MAGAMRAITLALLLAVALLSAGGASADVPGLFGSQEFRSPDLRPFPKWTGVMARHLTSLGKIAPACSRNQFGHCAPESWNEFLATLKGKSPRAQLDAVNAAMNRARYITDLVNWATQDYWATPSEFFWKDGDCEDYAIAKYLSLKALGFPQEALRVAVVQDLNLKIPHAILVVYLDGKALLLDNQISTVIEAERVRHYRPIFSLNETAWWLHR